MGAFVDVPNFFSSVYLVDLSPSLCQIARGRFQRLGWKNVKVVCEDARTFSLSKYEKRNPDTGFPIRSPVSSYSFQRRTENSVANFITMSYSLSMIVSSSTICVRRTLIDLYKA